MTAFLLVLAAIALVGAVATVPLLLRDGYAPIRSVEGYDTRRPKLRG